MQTNESYSRRNVLRGLHFQWNNPMGKLVRTISGHMIDLILDLRIGSPTQGKIMAFNMPIAAHESNSSWVWVPEGCAHGNFFLEDSYIEYYCSASYNGQCESGVSPFAQDIDWSICEPKLKNLFFDLKDSGRVIWSCYKSRLGVLNTAPEVEEKENNLIKQFTQLKSEHFKVPFLKTNLFPFI